MCPPVEGRQPEGNLHRWEGVSKPSGKPVGGRPRGGLPAAAWARQAELPSPEPTSRLAWTRYNARPRTQRSRAHLTALAGLPRKGCRATRSLVKIVRGVRTPLPNNGSDSGGK
jgi:hypothetical protein